MQIPDEFRLGAELLGVVGSAGVVLFKLGRLGERFDYHSAELRDTKVAVEKMEEALVVLAVQKHQIQSILDMIQQNARRTDETFTRIFDRLDKMPPPP